LFGKKLWNFEVDFEAGQSNSVFPSITELVNPINHLVDETQLSHFFEISAGVAGWSASCWDNMKKIPYGEFSSVSWGSLCLKITANPFLTGQRMFNLIMDKGDQQEKEFAENLKSIFGPDLNESSVLTLTTTV
jgi:hypothetical protein